MKFVCPNCYKTVEVKEETDRIVCPSCGSSFSKEIGSEMLDKRYKLLIEKAYSLTYKKMKYDSAIVYYEEALTLIDNDMTALVGLCLAKLYGQSFDDLKFQDVINVFESHDIMLDGENTFIFMNFISDVLRQVKFFYAQAEARLIHDGVFLAEEYFSYFKNGVMDIDNLLNYFANAFEICEPEEYQTFLNENPEFLNVFKEIKQKNKSFEGETFNVNGVGDVTFDGEKKGINVKQVAFVPMEDLHLIIEDRELIRLKNIFFAVLGSLGAIALTIIIVGASLGKNGIIYYSLIPIGIAVIFFLIAYDKLKKKVK
jgi:tetratricopeptide (TPR) repeat protein